MGEIIGVMSLVERADVSGFNDSSYAFPLWE